LKIGINLVGVSGGRNWQLYKSIKENIIDCWSDHQVNVYITTYKHDSNESLLEYYKPTKYQILDNSSDSEYKGINNPQQVATFIRSLEFIKNEDLDFIISTRFDIDFYSKFNIDFNKINFLFREGHYWEWHKLVTDNLFCFPIKYIDLFIESAKEIYNEVINNRDIWMPGLHFICSKLLQKIDQTDINFIFGDIDQYSHDNKYYRLRLTT